MPVKKTLKRSKASKITDDKELISEIKENKVSESVFSKKNLLIAGLIVIAVLFWFLKNYLIVATVNGQPVSRFELNQRLYGQYGSSVVDQLVNERLLLGAVRQKGIFITSAEIDNKVKEIEKSLDGKMTLDQALAAQGMSATTFKRQLEIQLSVEKMFAKEATVSSAELDEYIKNNKEMFATATDTAKLNADVENFLKQQKVTKLYEEWFNNIKKDAKISKNIK